MDRSRFLAGLIGPVLTAVAVSIFINSAAFAEMARQMTFDYALIFIAGVITMTAGLAIVLAHNVWKGWAAVITVFGWLAVVGGALRILIPGRLAQWGAGLIDQGWPVMVIAGLLLVFGLILSLKAFRA